MDAYQEPSDAQLRAESARIVNRLIECQMALSEANRGLGQQFILSENEKASLWKALELLTGVLERVEEYRNGI